MKLDRNMNSEGKGKYALVLLRNVTTDSEEHGMVEDLAERGVVDWGNKGDDGEFFVIRLKDKYAEAALMAYANAAVDDDKEWATQVLAMATRAAHHPAKKQPD